MKLITCMSGDAKLNALTLASVVIRGLLRRDATARHETLATCLPSRRSATFTLNICFSPEVEVTRQTPPPPKEKKKEKGKKIRPSSRPADRNVSLPDKKQKIA